MPQTSERERLSRLLIVEDDPSQLRTLTNIMRKEGFEVIGASTGAEALESIEREDFGVAVVDLRLPDYPGTQLLEKINARNANIRIIINTGYSSFDSAKEAVNLGAFAYVEKAGNPEELVRRVHDASRWHLERYATDLEDAVAARTSELRKSNDALRLEIAERQRAEKERFQLKEQLHHSQKMEAIGQLAGGMTHNFSNLLQVISGNIDILKQSVGDHDPAVHKTLTLANEACEQAVELARSLLTFSRRTTTEKQTIDLRSIVQSAARLLERTLPATVQLVVDEGGDTPVWVDGDQAQLQQVLINLAINARDAMPDGGTLTISVEQIDGNAQRQLTDALNVEDSFARVVVSDTGTGMPSDVQARIFEPFFTTKSREEGTGLGLSIVHGVVEDHGGYVEVHSEIGVGSTFSIFLPCVHPESKDVMVEPSTDVPRGHGELILLAAGDRQVRAIVAANLGSVGYEVVQVDDGSGVLECADHRGSAIRLFVLEQDLSEHTGLECLQRIRAAGIQTPAIIISDMEQAHLEEQLDNETALLRKPFLLHELARRVADRLAPARQAGQPARRVGQPAKRAGQPAKRAGPPLREESVS